ncbi:MAG: hypothetical protein QM764_12180 [Chitinophagaceae bacterium]
MQFDEFDKKIKEAAEHHHPAYEEKAWEKMETLLDKHMPVEKDDRRRFAFLILFLLMGGFGIYLAISKPWQQKKDVVATASASAAINDKTTIADPEKNANPKTGATEANPDAEQKSSPETSAVSLSDKTNIDKTVVATPQEASKDAVAIETKLTTSKLKQKGSISSPINQTTPNNNNTLSVPASTNGRKIKNTRSNTQDHQDIAEANKTLNQSINSLTNKKANNNQTEPSLSATASTESATSNTIIQNTPSATSDKTSSSDSVSKQKTNDIAKADNDKKKDEPLQKQTPKPGKQRKSSFAITFSAGPDLSAVGVSRIGGVRPVYGAGLSYTLNRVTIRSGFYAARKVYTAGANDYHAPGYVLPSNIELTKVDADCRLFEIPLTAAYTVSSSKKQNWFVSAGASSFLMKKEDYGYYYKNTTTGADWSRDWSLKNGENHIFSILDFSVGYERRINKTLSIIAEPYIKVPLDGVGFGSIRLNSAGVLFTLSVKPFVNRK